MPDINPCHGCHFTAHENGCGNNAVRRLMGRVSSDLPTQAQAWKTICAGRYKLVPGGARIYQPKQPRIFNMRNPALKTKQV